MLNTADNTLDKPKFSALLTENNFDFMDFGCGIGGSMFLAKKMFDGERGLGLDISKTKVDNAIAQGYDAACVNILTLPIMPKHCRFIMISHFLEHLSSVKDAGIMIRNAIALARDFVYIQQPYFDADGMLFQEGYKLFWSDWHGHPNRMTSLEFHNILLPYLEEGIISRFVIYAHKEIKRASNPTIHPISSPIDQHAYDPNIHPSKKSRLTSFSYPVYHEIRVLINTGEFDAVKHYAPKINSDLILFDSEAI